MMKVLTCKNSTKSLESPDVKVGELEEALQLFSTNFLSFLLCLEWRQEGISFLSKWGLKRREVSWHPTAPGGLLSPTTTETCVSALTLFQSENLQLHAWMNLQISMQERRPGWLNRLVNVPLIEQILSCLTNWLTASEQLIWHVFNHVCQSVMGGGVGQTFGV